MQIPHPRQSPGYITPVFLSHKFHLDPDASVIFSMTNYDSEVGGNSKDGGWVYVSNSDVVISN